MRCMVLQYQIGVFGSMQCASYLSHNRVNNCFERIGLCFVKCFGWNTIKKSGMKPPSLRSMFSDPSDMLLVSFLGSDCISLVNPYGSCAFPPCHVF